MKTIRLALVTTLVISLSAPAFAGGLRDSVAAAATAAAQQPLPAKSSSHKVATVGGAALFAAGMAIGLNAFINNENGEFSEFGEADAVNKPLGAAGISMAFAGGMIMFLGSHAKNAPSLSIQKNRVSVRKAISW